MRSNDVFPRLELVFPRLDRGTQRCPSADGSRGQAAGRRAQGLRVEDLSFSYSDHAIIQNLSFELSPGECLHVQGENGAGKTTLLRLLVGLIRPCEGQLLWRGSPIDETYLRQLVYVSHQNGLSEALTLEENLQLDWHFGRRRGALTEGIKALQLSDGLTTPIAHLSKGQQRKAALLRLWMTDAMVWVLDEPLTALDVESQQVVLSWIQAHLTASGMVILTSHQPLTQLHPVRIMSL